MLEKKYMYCGSQVEIIFSLLLKKELISPFKKKSRVDWMGIQPQ